MADYRVATRYVKAILNLAQEQGAVEELHKDMQWIARVCRDSFDLVSMLRNPIIKHDKKRAVLEKIFKGRVHQLTLAVINILTRKNREVLLPSIASGFHLAYNEFKGIQKATITTTIPLDEGLRKEIEAMAKKIGDKNLIELEEKLDKELIGGFVLLVDDKQLDASISSKLKSLRVLFSDNPYIREY